MITFVEAICWGKLTCFLIQTCSRLCINVIFHLLSMMPLRLLRGLITLSVFILSERSLKGWSEASILIIYPLCESLACRAFTWLLTYARSNGLSLFNSRSTREFILLRRDPRLSSRDPILMVLFSLDSHSNLISWTIHKLCACHLWTLPKTLYDIQRPLRVEPSRSLEFRIMYHWTHVPMLWPLPSLSITPMLNVESAFPHEAS